MATGEARSRRRKALRRRAVAATSLVVVVGAGAATATAVNGATPQYQIGEVKTASVTQTIESSGTVNAATKATPSFAVSGTVTSVDVKVGQTVRKGAALATLDTTSLRASVDSAESTLASAKQRLEADKTGQTSSGGASATFSAYEDTGSTAVTAAVATGSATIVPAADNTTASGALQDVVAAQDKVIAAQKAVDDDQEAVDAAQKPVDDDIKENLTLSDAQKSACATSDSSTSSAECVGAQADYEASAGRLADDMKALDSAISAQDKAVAALDEVISNLDAALKKLQSVSTGSTSGSGSAPSGSSPTGSTSTGSKSTGSTPSVSKSSGGNATSAQPASAAQLAADQASIDAAVAALAEVDQNLAAATLTAPITGTVAAVGLTTGESAGSGVITIVGAGVQKISTTVPLSHIDLVKVGEQVVVAADGVAAKLHGTVTAIGMLSTTSGSSTTFPVTVTLDDEQPSLYDGTGADVVITTGTAKNVTTVPNSALHVGPGGTYTVTVLNNGVSTTKRVTIGVAGPDVTEVKSGVAIGDQVVLADLSEALPTSATSTTTRGGTGGFGGFGGFGGPPTGR